MKPITITKLEARYWVEWWEGESSGTRSFNGHRSAMDFAKRRREHAYLRDTRNVRPEIIDRSKE